MRLNDNNSFIGINPPYQLSVIHSSKLIYKQDSTLVAEQTTIFSVSIFLCVNI